MGLLDVLRGNNITPEMAKARPGLFHLLNRDTGNSLQDMGATLSALAWGGHPDDYTKISANRTDRNRYQIEQDAADRTAKAWTAKVAAAENYAKKIELSNPDLAAALRANPDNLDVLTKSNLDLRNVNQSTDHRLAGEQGNWREQNTITNAQGQQNEKTRIAGETAKDISVTDHRLAGEQGNWKTQNDITSQQAIDLSRLSQEAETKRQIAVMEATKKLDPFYQLNQTLQNAGSASSSAAGQAGGASPSSPTVGVPPRSGMPIDPEVLAKLQSQLGVSAAPTPTPAPLTTAATAVPPAEAKPQTLGPSDEHSIAIGEKFGIPNLTTAEARVMETAVGLKDSGSFIKALTAAQEARGMVPMSPAQQADLANKLSNTDKSKKEAAHVGIPLGMELVDPNDPTKGIQLMKGNESGKLALDKAKAEVSIAQQNAAQGSAPAASVFTEPFDPANPNKVRTLVANPGGTQTQLPAQAAAEIGLGKGWIAQIPQIKENIAKSDLGSDNPAKRAAAYTKASLGFGDEGGVMRRIDDGKDSMLRMLTGAGMPESEAKEYTRRFGINIQDSKATIADKVDQLNYDLNNIHKQVMSGHGDQAITEAETKLAAERTKTKDDAKGAEALPDIVAKAGITKEQWDKASPEDKKLLMGGQ